MDPQTDPTEQFGKYHLLRRLGSGGMAEVYLAELAGPEGFQKLVALKRILPDLCNDEDFISSFISEARLGGSLNHPNIVQTLELGREQGQYFLAMEYVKGLTLNQLLSHRRTRGASIPVSVVLEVARQLCDALSYAHTATDARGNPLNMIHRDLKPDNVLVSEFGAVKITDFGVARANTNLKRTVNQAEIKGTIAYMSPEQAQGMPIDQRTDLYSLGALIFEMLTLEPLYPDASGFSGLFRVQKGELEDRLKLLEVHHPSLQQTMTRLLSADPKQRHGSAVELKRELVTIATSVPTSLYDMSELARDAMAARQAMEGSWSLSFSESSSLPSNGTLRPGGGSSSHPSLAHRAPESAAQARSAETVAGPMVPRAETQPTPPPGARQRSIPGMVVVPPPMVRISEEEAIPTNTEVESAPSLSLTPAQPFGSSPSQPSAPSPAQPFASSPSRSSSQPGAKPSAKAAAGPPSAPGKAAGLSTEARAFFGQDSSPRARAHNPNEATLVLDPATRPPPLAPVPVAPPVQASKRPLRFIGLGLAAVATIAVLVWFIAFRTQEVLLEPAAVQPSNAASRTEPSRAAGSATDNGTGIRSSSAAGTEASAHSGANPAAAPPSSAPETSSSKPPPANPKATAVKTDEPTAPRAPSKPATAPAAAPPGRAPNTSSASAAPAFLSVNSRPFAYVYVNGRKLHEPTPLFDAEVPSGRINLEFRTDDGRKHGPIKLTLKAGEHKQLEPVIFEP